MNAVALVDMWCMNQFRLKSCALVCLLLAVPGVQASTVAFSFTASEPASIPALGPASPSSWPILVKGVGVSLLRLTVRIEGLTHTCPNDLGAVLAGPSGAPVVLFDGPGNGCSPGAYDWEFRDDASTRLPDLGSLSSGAFQPGQNEYASTVAAIPGPYSTDFGDLIGIDPNGLWQLAIEDFSDLDGGTVRSWSLYLETTEPLTTVPEPSSLLLILGGCAALVARQRFQ